jgi:ubiquinone/menaquinone biosynthesis C-methylase UbiE
MKKRHIATEQKSLEEIFESLPKKKRWAKAIFSRISRIVPLDSQAKILDVGSAYGGFLLACHQLGYQCEGIEPWEEARKNAIHVSEKFDIPIKIKEGVAESIPYEDKTFDMVHASSVIEHVLDVEKAFSEIYRVLKPGGVFWFNASSAMCPKQNEIRGFPLFGWYPNSLKLKIMHWVKDAHPHLVGYTRTPAINWFTPSKANKLLKQAGFKEVYDRWDLVGENEGGRLSQFILPWVRSTKLTKMLANMTIVGCSYAAIKPKDTSF